MKIFKIACYLCCQATATLNHCKIMLILSFLYRMIYSNVRTLSKIRTRLKTTVSIRLRKIRLMISPIQLTKLITGKLMNEKCRCQQNGKKVWSHVFIIYPLNAIYVGAYFAKEAVLSHCSTNWERYDLLCVKELVSVQTGYSMKYVFWSGVFVVL